MKRFRNDQTAKVQPTIALLHLYVSLGKILNVYVVAMVYIWSCRELHKKHLVKVGKIFTLGGGGDGGIVAT